MLIPSLVLYSTVI